MQLAHEYLKTPTKVLNVSKLKFRRLVRPGAGLSLTLSFDVETSRLSFSFADGEHPVSAGVLQLGKP